MFIPNTHHKWLTTVINKNFQDIDLGDILNRPIVAWFKNTESTPHPHKQVRILTKLHPASNVDSWGVADPTGRFGFGPKTLQEIIQYFGDEGWTACEFEDETSYLKALIAFKFQS